MPSTILGTLTNNINSLNTKGKSNALWNTKNRQDYVRTGKECHQGWPLDRKEWPKAHEARIAEQPSSLGYRPWILS